ncbi:PhnD/SsuA/transferrin family substrate-binding protein [Candidatus Sumerlaeota bacterium]|nr:PhnD/SsuA/transferrin family substrate-binding protein [Candidatus Sumerlaeota bacterium]
MGADKDAPTTASLNVKKKENVAHAMSLTQLSGVDVHDAETATTVWLKALYGKTHKDIIGVKFYSDYLEIYKAVRAGEVNGASILGIEYLALPDRSVLQPFSATIRDKTPETTYVVLVPIKGGANSLNDLKGKTVLLESGFTGLTGSLWLEVILMRQKLPESSRFFDETTLVEKPSAAVLPVFFKQADACVVPKRSFMVMQELNPQIGKRVKILLESPPLLEVISCHSTLVDWSEEELQDLKNMVFNIGNSPEGEQFMNLFQSSGVALWDESYLVNLQALVREYEERSGKKFAQWMLEKSIERNAEVTKK